MMKVLLFSYCFFLAFFKVGTSYAGDYNQEWLNLLHYDNGVSVVDKNSSFFLSKEGYKNPNKELEATISAFLAKDNNNDNHAICKFPARLEYVLKNTDYSDKDFAKPNCPKYKEFLQLAPIDKVFVVFASENNTMPTSIMGHIFIKISGVSGGKKREHSFSYFADNVNTQSIGFYWDVIVNSIDGSYALGPYKKKADEYLKDEQRPLWEFELKVSKEQKKYLQKHLWELKGQNVRYSFVAHNCGTGTINLIKIIYPDVAKANIFKPFETPMDYIKSLNNNKIVNQVNLIPSQEYLIKSKNYAQKNILDAKASSQIYVGYNSFRSGVVELKYMPIYQDFYDVSKAYYDDIETKMLNIELGIDKNLYINKIDIINMRAIKDASVDIGLYSQYIKVALENDLGQTNTAIKPVIEGGIGYGYAVFSQLIKPYILPKIGYRYNDVNNFYVAPELGVIIKPIDDAKIVINYEKYFDSKANNRNYNEKFAINFAYLLNENTTLYSKYNKYSDTSYNKDELVVGIGYNF